MSLDCKCRQSSRALTLFRVYRVDEALLLREKFLYASRCNSLYLHRRFRRTRCEPIIVCLRKNIKDIIKVMYISINEENIKEKKFLILILIEKKLKEKWHKSQRFT